MEPVVALYEQGRIHHIGDPLHFAELEEQMLTWVPPPPGKRTLHSPDRVDALVHAITELNIMGRKPRPDIAGVPMLNFEQANPWSI